MLEIFITFILGIICIFLGISNMKGNINSLHSYHRHRVLESDRIPFGKKVGLGTIIIGISIILFSILLLITLFTNIQTFELIGNIILILGILIGLIISFSSMIKYNKGIF